MSVSTFDSDDQWVDARGPPMAGAFVDPFASTSPSPGAAHSSRSPPAGVFPGAASSISTSICGKDLQSPQVTAASIPSDSGLNQVSTEARTPVQPSRPVRTQQQPIREQPQPTQSPFLRRTSSYKRACHEHGEVGKLFYSYNYYEMSTSM